MNTEGSIDPKPTGLLLSRDLFFSSKITGTAEVLGFHIAVKGGLEEAGLKEADPSYCCIFIDLSMPGLRVPDVIGAMPTNGRPPVIAFGSHVMTTQLKEAREAGCDEVFVRSQFSATLPEILTRYLKHPK